MDNAGLFRVVMDFLAGYCLGVCCVWCYWLVFLFLVVVLQVFSVMAVVT